MAGHGARRSSIFMGVCSLEVSLPYLPDDLILECLVRVPRASLPPLPAVCRRFADLLASHAFLQLRRARGLLQPSLLALSVSDHAGAAFAQALLHFRPGQPPHVQVSALPLPPALHRRIHNPDGPLRLVLPRWRTDAAAAETDRLSHIPIDNRRGGLPSSLYRCTSRIFVSSAITHVPHSPGKCIQEVNSS
ncbi:uncharacterized protein [Lolium perenne]|uniref:uncharacterized protein n=1 Tax=Lolium perenne TaxID=4522 RepID=UPI003A99B92C